MISGHVEKMLWLSKTYLYKIILVISSNVYYWLWLQRSQATFKTCTVSINKIYLYCWNEFNGVIFFFNFWSKGSFHPFASPDIRKWNNRRGFETTQQWSKVSGSNMYCCWLLCNIGSRGRGGEGVPPIMAYTGRLLPKGVPFSGSRKMKG